jgi:two-component system nitrate/nitrite response regulator NarL
LLQTDPRLLVVGDTSTPARTVALVRELRADILLFGIGIDSSGGRIGVLRELARSGLPVRTILLVDRVERTDVCSALQFGVCSVIPRDSPPERLFDAIHSAMTERPATTREPIHTVASDIRRLATSRRRSHAFSLTRRETEILCGVADGQTNRDIALKLSISENTVKSHIGHLFNKLGASNRLELALFAKHHRLLEGV